MSEIVIRSASVMTVVGVDSNIPIFMTAKEKEASAASCRCREFWDIQTTAQTLLSEWERTDDSFCIVGNQLNSNHQCHRENGTKQNFHWKIQHINGLTMITARSQSVSRNLSAA